MNFLLVIIMQKVVVRKGKKLVVIAIERHRCSISRMYASIKCISAKNLDGFMCAKYYRESQ